MRTTMRHMILAALVVAMGACDRAEIGQKPGPAATVSATGTPTAANRVEIIVDQRGYTPSSVSVAKGSPVTLSFMRTTDATCATEVVFPDLHVEKPLPLNTAVEVPVPAGDAKTYAFACGMGMHRGKVVVQ
jgi:plastocyanin domain-containing protein